MAENIRGSYQLPQEPLQQQSRGTETAYDPGAPVYSQPATTQLVYGGTGGYGMTPGYGGGYPVVPPPPREENNTTRNVVIGLVIVCCVLPIILGIVGIVIVYCCIPYLAAPKDH